MPLRLAFDRQTRLKGVIAATAIVAVLAAVKFVEAQFISPTCVPPDCNPQVIQNISPSASPQTADFHISGDGGVGSKFLVGTQNPVLNAAAQNLYYGNVSGSSTAGSLMLLQFGAADRFRVTLAGQLQVPPGSAAAPSYSFLGDTNTGIYSSGADTLNFVTNGTDRVTVSSTGAVNVPGDLAVGGSFSAPGGVSGDGSGLTNINASNITSGTLSDSRLSSNVALRNAANDFTAQNTFTGANFGVGTSSPAAPFHFNSSTTTAGDNGLRLCNGTCSHIFWGSTRDWYIRPGNTSTGRILVADTGGLVGIGTSSPSSSYKLDVNGNTRVTGNLDVTGTITGSGVISGSGTVNYVTKFTGTSSVGNSQIFDNGTNVGIGTATPSQKLHVAGNVQVDGTLSSTGGYSGDGSGLTNLNASNITTGTLADARLSTNVMLLNNTQTVTGAKTFSNASNSFTGSGAGLTSLNASNITTGTLADARLSTNVMLLNNTQTVTGAKTFSNAANSFTGSFTGNGSGLTNLNWSSLVGFPAACPGGQYVTAVGGTLTCSTPPGLGGSGTANTVAKFTGATTLGNSLIQDNGTGVAIGGTPAGTALTVIGPTNLSNALTATSNAASGVGIWGFGLGSSSVGVYGQGQGSGVTGVGGGAGGVGVQGTGNYAGVTGTTANQWGYGVLGTVPSNSYVYGVYGITGSSQFTSAGVAGINTGNGMGGYFQSNNGTTYALLAYNGAGGFAFQAQGTSSFTGAVSMNSTLSVTGATTLSNTLRLGSLSSDPAGTNGMMYYNSSTGAMRCYEGGSWKNCIPPSGVTSVTGGSGISVAPTTGAVVVSSTDTLADVSARGRFTGTYISVNGAMAAFDVGVASYGSGIGVSGQAGAGGTGISGWGGSIGGQFTGTSYGVYGATGGSYGGYFSGGTYGVYAYGTSYALYGSGNAYVSGNLGLGIGPSHKLDVNGNVNVSGGIGAGPLTPSSGYGIRASGTTMGGYFQDATSGETNSYAYLGYFTYGGIFNSSNSQTSYNNIAVQATASSGYQAIGLWASASGGSTANWGVYVSNGGAAKPGGGSWSATSDRRVKKDVFSFSDGLDVVRKIEPVEYTYNGLGEMPEGFHGIGVIAQDLQKVAPYMVFEDRRKLSPDDAEPTALYMVDPSAFTYISLNAIKELDIELRGLEARVVERQDAAEERLRKLETRVRELEARLNELE